MRQATGLVREFSWIDTLNISISAVTPTVFGIGITIVTLSSAVPGANMPLAIILGLLVVLPVGITYSLLAGSMPRSGGDYVWISRTINPVLGFMTGWGFWLASVTLLGAVNAYVQAAVIIPTFLATVGYGTGTASLVNAASTISGSTVDVFAIGLLFLVIISSVSAFGPKVFSRLMILLFAIVMVSVVTAFAVLLTSSHSDFVSAVSGYGGTNMTYDSVIAQATAGGWSFTPTTLQASLAALPIALYAFFGFNFAAAASGEVKNARRTMFYGIVGSLVIGAILFAAGIQLVVNVVGAQFIQASLAIGSSWPLAAAPWMPLFVAMLTHNSVVLLVVELGWLVSLLWGGAGFFLVVTRYVFAFAFDRVFPARFADINDRIRFPIKAAALNIVVAATFLYLATFTSFIGLLLNTSAISSIVWAMGSVVAIVLPFKKKDVVRNLPGANWKIPLVSMVGSISLIVMLLTFYFALTIPGVGPSTPQADAILLTIFVVGAVVYTIGYLYHKGHGIDMKAIYSELPPE